MVKKNDNKRKNIQHLTFSPTRSSFRAGSHLSCNLGNEILMDVTKRKSRNFDLKVLEKDILVISFPVYSGRIPELFSSLFKKSF